MTENRPLSWAPATPDYVLAVFRDQYRQLLQYDSCTEPDIDLTFDTTIADWRSACDFKEWRGLADALQEEWNLDRSMAEWRAVLNPARKRTLGDLCEFIAHTAQRPTIEPLNILGRPCLPAGAFLAVRSILQEAGADPAAIRPSATIDPYLREYPGAFLGRISQLAPNALPNVKVASDCELWQDRAALGLLLAYIAVAIFSYFFPLLAAPGLILVTLIYAAISAIFSRKWPFIIKFDNIQTFRDLAKVLSGQPQSGAHDKF